MNEPRRLLDGEADSFEQDLLRSAHDDRGSDKLLRRTLKAVSAGVAVTTAASAGAAGTAIASANGIGAAAPWLVVAKWFGVGLISGSVAIGAISLSRQSSPPSPSPTNSVNTIAPLALAASASQPEGPTASAPIATPPQPASSITAPASHLVDPPKPAIATSAGTPIPSVPEPADSTASTDLPAVPASPSATSSIAEEIATIDRARSALQAGRARDALATVDQYQQRFPRGSFGPEATVLRIESLVRLGDRATAARIAESFLASPASRPHATRVRSLIGSVSNP